MVVSSTDTIDHIVSSLCQQVSDLYSFSPEVLARSKAFSNVRLVAESIVDAQSLLADSSNQWVWTKLDKQLVGDERTILRLLKHLFESDSNLPRAPYRTEVISLHDVNVRTEVVVSMKTLFGHTRKRSVRSVKERYELVSRT